MEISNFVYIFLFFMEKTELHFSIRTMQVIGKNEREFKIYLDYLGAVYSILIPSAVFKS